MSVSVLYHICFPYPCPCFITGNRAKTCFLIKYVNTDYVVYFIIKLFNWLLNNRIFSKIILSLVKNVEETG